MRSIAIVLALGLCSAAHAQQQPASKHSITPAQLHWTATEIPTLEMAVVSGDPTSAGPFVLRLRARGLVRIPPHWHPTDEHLTVLTGSPMLGMGDRFVEPALKHLPPGGYVLLPKESRHFALFKAGTVVQLHGEGPFVINWVDPSAVKALKSSDVDSLSERSKMKAEQDKR